MAEYDLDTFGQLVNDPVRMGAYARALERAVKPGCIVLDIGTGTGILALLACRYGARKVHAVEVDPVIEVARAIAAANGLQDRIEWHATDSMRLTLPERADVIVSDIYGVMPFHRRRIPVLADARERLLAPGGTMIPRRDRLWLAAVCAPELHCVVMQPWVRNAYGLDMRAARDLAANQWRRVEFSPGQLATQPACCAELDHVQGSGPNLDATVRARVARGAELHGFGAWFDAELMGDIGFSNAPGETSLIYGNAFFPWPEPVVAAAGDEVLIRLRATLVGEDYVWAWDSAVLAGGDDTSVRASFRQSTFLGMALSPDLLDQVSADHPGAINADGEVARVVLDGLARGAMLGEIAQALRRAFPERFGSDAEALAHVTRISLKYGR